MLSAFLISFGVIFAAELGDKSQLMALTFATRYPLGVVLVGITGATAIVHAVSVAIGGAMGATIPHRPITLIAAVAFVIFGLWTLRGDSLSDEEKERAKSNDRNALLVVGLVFFLAELGDKTMLATITLATKHGLVGTWAGSTIGMVAADALAIIVGRQLGARLPERVIKVAAALSFFGFSIWLFVDAARA